MNKPSNIASARVWSAYQQAVFLDVAQGVGNTCIDAVAGSGKTTTIVEAMKHVPAGKSCLFVAFNKSIALELQKRAPAGVTVSTLHAHGLKACSRALGRVRIDGDKTKSLAREVLGVEMEQWEILMKGSGMKAADITNKVRDWMGSIFKCVSLAKASLAETVENVEDVIDTHQITPPELEEEHPRFVRQVLKVLEACKEVTESVDFDDMVWLPTALNLSVPTYDRVFVDETQDLTAAQVALVLRSVKKDGRVCAVGDPRQAIYQFAGAMDDSFHQVKTTLAAKTLPLSVTYRCSLAVVREAQKIVPHLEPSPHAIEGQVKWVDKVMMTKEAREGDFILSRTNAPLLSLCLGFLKEGRSANIQGRDIGTKLTSIIRRTKATDVDVMLAKVGEWAAKEMTRLESRGKDSTTIEDTRECIYALCEGETLIDSILLKIGKLFADGDIDARITLSTTHKAKGLERDRVWLLRDTYLRTKKGQGVGMAEHNLLYVAITRAKRDLFLVQTE